MNSGQSCAALQVVALGRLGVRVEEKLLSPESKGTVFSLSCSPASPLSQFLPFVSPERRMPVLISTLGLCPESPLPKGEPGRKTGRVVAFSTPRELLKAQKPCWFYGRSQVCACLYAMLMEPTRKCTFLIPRREASVRQEETSPRWRYHIF